MDPVEPKGLLSEIVVPLELAKESGYTVDNIRRLTPALIKVGLARKAGKSTLFLKEQTLQWLENRPETRGRKNKTAPSSDSGPH